MRTLIISTKAIFLKENLKDPVLALLINDILCHTAPTMLHSTVHMHMTSNICMVSRLTDANLQI